MKRIVFPALAAFLLVSCEKPIEPVALAPDALTSSTAQTTFSGQATVLKAVAQVPNAPPITITLGDTGPLPESGGARESSLLTVSPNQTGGILGAEVVHAATVGQGQSSRSEASVAEANLTVAGNSIRAGLLQSRAQATCDGSGAASASGSSEIVGLVINGQAIVVSGQPNQTVVLPLGSGRVVLNEQSSSTSGGKADITVNALHVTVFDPSGGAPLADVVISSAHADIRCAGCPSSVGDFVTGGGWITPSGAKANFGVAGGRKNGALWGHLTYIDHGPGGPKVRGTEVTGYSGTGLSRHIEGTAEVNGVSGFTYQVDVTDNGEPGRDDVFSITLQSSDGTRVYSASGKLGGGNIQLHGPSPCP